MLNDLQSFLNKGELYKFADDNAVSAVKIEKRKEKEKDDLLNILKQESELVANWLRQNNLIANPGKFQSLSKNYNRQ